MQHAAIATADVVAGAGTVRLPKILYICSAARCGSTITDMFLGGHPGIASLGEVNHLGKAIRLRQMCTCGVKVVECPAWSKVFDSLKISRSNDLRRDPYGLRLWDARAVVVVDREHQTRTFLAGVKLRTAWLALRHALPGNLGAALPLPSSLLQALDNKMALYAAIAHSWGAQAIVDSSKNPWEAAELARRWPAQVKVVLLTRDGRGVYLSRRQSGFSRDESVRGWQRYYQRALPLLKQRVPAGSLLPLRYEEFAADPVAVGRRLCAAAGLEFVPSMLDLESGVRHMVNGNDTRFAPQKGIRLDERWRSELRDDELAYFMQYAGSLNSALGYA